MRTHGKHVDQCMFEFAVEWVGIDQMSANKEEHMMLWVIWGAQVGFQKVTYFKFNLFLNFKFDTGLGGASAV